MLEWCLVGVFNRGFLLGERMSLGYYSAVWCLQRGNDNVQAICFVMNSVSLLQLANYSDALHFVP